MISCPTGIKNLEWYLIEGLPIAALKTAIETVCDTIKFSVIEKPLATITHILFDMDGLLLDTEVLYTIAQNKILEPFGIKFSAEVKSMMMGRKALEAAEIMVRGQKIYFFIINILLTASNNQLRHYESGFSKMI